MLQEAACAISSRRPCASSAPPPACALQSSSVNGQPVAPTTGSPEASNATVTLTNGSPLTRFVVPSTGSTTQTHGASRSDRQISGEGGREGGMGGGGRRVVTVVAWWPGQALRSRRLAGVARAGDLDEPGSAGCSVCGRMTPKSRKVPVFPARRSSCGRESRVCCRDPLFTRTGPNQFAVPSWLTALIR